MSEMGLKGRKCAQHSGQLGIAAPPKIRRELDNSQDFVLMDTGRRLGRTNEQLVSDFYWK